VFILVYCPRKAGLHACTTVNAFEGVILYLSIFQTDFYSISRTHPGTIATQVTLASIPVNSASIAREGLPDILKRITSGSWSGEEVLYDCRKHPGHFSYLSVHAIQGSMDKVITGTSAISQPGNITNKVGMLAKVGVLTFNLSRLFVPLPLK
jgi:hypothetical protein